MRRFAALLLPAPLLLTAPTLGGCGFGHGCTLVGCNDSVEIALPAGLEHGEYVFEIDADGMTWTCGASVPVVEPPSCTGWDVHLFMDGAGTSITGVRLDWAPETPVAVRIRRDGVEVASREFPAKYEENYPNGEDCDEVPCRNAHHAITWEER